MAGRIPEDFIESLLERTDIVEVISSRVPLQRSGREYKACCPFHEEKTASFYVSPQKQFYHCFGCGVHGTAIGFVMQYEGLEFPDAIESLAADAGIEVPREGGHSTPAARFDGMLSALAAAQEWFRSQLADHAAAADYLQRRGVRDDVIVEFGVGYAPDRWDGLMTHLAGLGMAEAEVERAGLITSREDGRRYDRFRHRIMFPIHDRRGRVIAFGGRALSEQGPKYLNSPETPLFHKGKELYRLFQARRGARPEKLLVAEGYMDALTLHQYGFPNAVATLGTSVSAEQIRLLVRASPDIVFCFDGDRAGRQAAWRGLEAALPVLEAGHQLRFLFLPEGEDPDSLLKKHGAESLYRLLDDALPLPEFFFQELAAQVDMESLDGRARLVALARPHLERLRAGPLAEMMHDELARRTGYKGQTSVAAVPSQVAQIPGAQRMSLMRHAIALLVQYPALAQQVEPADLQIAGEIPGIALLRELIDFCRQKPHLSTAMLLERWRDRSETPHLALLAAREMPGDEDSREREFRSIVARIRKQLIEARCREMQHIRSLRDLTEQEHIEWQQFNRLLAESKTKHLES